MLRGRLRNVDVYGTVKARLAGSVMNAHRSSRVPAVEPSIVFIPRISDVVQILKGARLVD
jgi:hypothetical protein